MPPPPPVAVDGLVAVPADLEHVDATIEFDCGARQATVEATVRFRAGADDGCPLFDLRQPIDEAVLDGERLDPAELRHRDLGGGEGAHVRVLSRPLPAGTGHTLVLRYRLGTPAAAGALPPGWTPDRPGLLFDLWMSDLSPGRYLEMWLPANLVHDRFALTLDVRVASAAVPHSVVANTPVDWVDETSFRLAYPESFTAFSPMLVIAPADQVERRRLDDGPLTIHTASLADAGVDVAAAEAATEEALLHNRTRFGRYVHGERFAAWIWTGERGMEYDGGTTSPLDALPHDVFHSWFGRGVKPATAADGWIDEALATWTTRGGLVAHPLDPRHAEPVVLRPPHPYTRHTPREAYAVGARLCAGLAHLMGVDALLDALATLYEAKAGGFLSTDELQAHLSEAASVDLGPWFDRLVHGRPSP